MGCLITSQDQRSPTLTETLYSRSSIPWAKETRAHQVLIATTPRPQTPYPANNSSLRNASRFPIPRTDAHAASVLGCGFDFPDSQW